MEMSVEKEKATLEDFYFSVHYGDVKEEVNATLNGLTYKEAH